MPKKGLMVAVYHDDSRDDAVSYALELARIMKKGLSILMIYRKKLTKKFEDYMVTATFAEEGDFKTAKELIMEDLKKKGIDYEEKLRKIREKCNSVNVEFLGVSMSANDIMSAIKNIFKKDNSVEMVLLSSSITQDGHISDREIQRLATEISVPIVTIEKKINETE